MQLRKKQNIDNNAHLSVYSDELVRVTLGPRWQHNIVQLYTTLFSACNSDKILINHFAWTAECVIDSHLELKYHVICTH